MHCTISCRVHLVAAVAQTGTLPCLMLLLFTAIPPSLRYESDQCTPWFYCHYTKGQTLRSFLTQVAINLNRALTLSFDCPLQVQLEGGRQQYRPVVMALTEKDILLFESVPWSRESWSMPLLTHPLLATRYRLQTAWGTLIVDRSGVHISQITLL